MKVPIITIPTYWTRKDAKKKVGDAYFDHPTPLNGNQTLTRTLDSLKNVQGKFKVVIVVATVDYSDDNLYKQVNKKIHSLIKGYNKHYPIMQFSKSDVQFLKNRMKKYGLADVTSQINLGHYPAIRNCQLIATNALDANVMIGLDDDEIIMPDHVEKATKFIGKKYKGNMIYGIGGYYRDKNGEYIMKDLKKPKVDNLFYKKRIMKNKGFINIDRKKGRVQKSNFVFGGNMVMHRKMFMNISYDLGIPRGENMDYLINAKAHGLDFYFDKKLYIIHMPPETWGKKMESFLKTGAFSMASYHKLEQDIMRFVYEREKIRGCNDKYCPLHKVDIDELKPYPGEFFGKKLIGDAVYALKHMYPEELKKHNITAERFINNSIDRARKLVPGYFIFNQRWIKLMNAIEKDKVLKKHIRSKWL
jgi:hypothetical protein|tara:strand:+ start:5446 stop:6696 length:1251 start_codon:yes stop_codon:yes gene_type:complete